MTNNMHVILAIHMSKISNEQGGDIVVSTAASQHHGPGFDSPSVVFLCVEFSWTEYQYYLCVL